VTPLGDLQALAAVAREAGLPIHLDGARLWNAAAATGTPLADFAACVDTVMVSFSKGLGAPVGAALAGSHEVIHRAHEARKRFGGGMRQSGILAAAALYGLDHHLPDLAQDHANARALAGIMGGVRGASVVPPDTNIVMVDLPPGVVSFDLVARCAERGVRITPWWPTRIRMVTHRDVTADEVREAGGIVAEVLASMLPAG
jgi:threonine aldolase